MIRTESYPSKFTCSSCGKWCHKKACVVIKLDYPTIQRFCPGCKNNGPPILNNNENTRLRTAESNVVIKVPVDIGDLFDDTSHDDQNIVLPEEDLQPHRSLVGLSSLRITQEQEHRCLDCDKAYATKYALKRHMFVHQEKRKANLYTCPDCSMKLSRSDSLKRHLEVCRGGPLKHICEICSKPFTQKCNLQRHMLVHGTQK